MAEAFSQGGQASFSGIIFFGPFPIVFGAGSDAQWLILMAVILAVLTLIMLLILHKKPLDKRA
jgi:uncharacterized membrane protein